ncbi:MAG: endonuclease/exonuclease/phosphatase family protein [Spirochaetia bacterium]|nr:endonuclease/exonuclease/phosphatase family protein [Spirochaetia bacterium]
MKKNKNPNLMRKESGKQVGAAGLLCVLLILFLTACGPGCVLQGSGVNSGKNDITIMSWNVENLFDGTDNGTEYKEFDPGEGNWDTSRYHTRLASVARVITEFINPIPDIICLQEIEHAGVVNDLLRWNLKQYGFNYSAVTDAAGSAIQLGIISRFPITQVKIHSAGTTGVAGYSLRPVLEVEIIVGNESLIVLVNHWKSRIGGEEITEPARIASANIVRRILYGNSLKNPGKMIVCAGDLNENANEYELAGELYQTALMPQTIPDTSSDTSAMSLKVTGFSGNVSDELGVLYNPWLDTSEGVITEGSYVFRSKWAALDHIMVSEAAFDNVGLDFLSFTTFTHPWMLNSSGEPASWNIRSGEGYSDHLPVLMTLTTSSVNTQVYQDQSPTL